MDDLIHRQNILIELIADLIALESIMRLVGLDTAGVRSDVQRLVRRLVVVNRKIEEHGQY